MPSLSLSGVFFGDSDENRRKYQTTLPDQMEEANRSVPGFEEMREKYAQFVQDLLSVAMEEYRGDHYGRWLKIGALRSANIRERVEFLLRGVELSGMIDDTIYRALRGREDGVYPYQIQEPYEYREKPGEPLTFVCQKEIQIAKWMHGPVETDLRKNTIYFLPNFFVREHSEQRVKRKMHMSGNPTDAYNRLENVRLLNIGNREVPDEATEKVDLQTATADPRILTTLDELWREERLYRWSKEPQWETIRSSAATQSSSELQESMRELLLSSCCRKGINTIAVGGFPVSFDIIHEPPLESKVKK